MGNLGHPHLREPLEGMRLWWCALWGLGAVGMLRWLGGWGQPLAAGNVPFLTVQIFIVLFLGLRVGIVVCEVRSHRTHHPVSEIETCYCVIVLWQMSAHFL